MNEIIKTDWIAEEIREIWFKNELIAKNFKPGQFLVIHKDKKGERIPLTIVDVKDGNIRIIIQRVGYTTARLCELKKDENLKDVAGPLGKPTHIEKFGKVLCLAGGIGSAPLKPVAAALKAAGNSLKIIEGVRCIRYLILKEELEELADELIITSDDGSIGEKAIVTKPFRDMLDKGDRPDLVYAVGPPVMMHAVSKITKEHGIPLRVSLNPIMVDGTGMCGSCRVAVDGETKFACVDGPEFDGNKVDFRLLMSRLRMYEKEEKLLRWEPGNC